MIPCNIPERPFQTTPTPQEAANHAYLQELGGKRTARHASEESKSSPDPKSVAEQTRYIRTDLQNIFDIQSDHLPVSETAKSTEQIKQEYWSRASRVGTEYGAKENFSLEDYLHVGAERDYASIKEYIEEEYAPDSIPRSVLDGIDAYHNVLEINPSTASSIIMELIGRSIGDIKSSARQIELTTKCSEQEATSAAFAEFITGTVPKHIDAIAEKHGRGDDAIRPYMNKPSFYPTADTPAEDDVLKLNYDDVEGLIQVYDIQSRPYNETELGMADQLAQLPEMQTAMIQTQETLVAFSEDYLQQHPERATGNLRNFSEIFAPEYNESGLELLPNPKLIRAMVNNVLPAVAQQLLLREATITEVSEEDIRAGIHVAAKEYKLFQTSIGQFKNYDQIEQTAELHSIYKVVCPANSLFPTFLTKYLASYYERAKNNTSAASAASR